MTRGATTRGQGYDKGTGLLQRDRATTRGQGYYKGTGLGVPAIVLISMSWVTLMPL